jgi:very-short-patch-repair endonuclease
MKKLNCLLCDFETDSQLKLSKHTSFSHQLKFPDYLIKYKYKGNHPLCQCGCNNVTNYNKKKGDFFDFLSGHHTKREGHWGDWNNIERVENIKKTRKKKFASGEYEHILNATKKAREENKEEWKESISKGAKGIPKPKPEGFGIGRKHSQETKDKMSLIHKEKWVKGEIGRRHYTSKLEDKFKEQILVPLNIEFKHTFKATNYKFFYDFIIPSKNLIIEVDGDFFHSNPKFYPEGPKYKTQIENNKNDQLKNQWAEDNGYKLLRFWEYDINNNPEIIIEILKKELNLL